jgi:putative transposase
MIFQMVLEWKRLMKNIGGKKLYDHLKHEIEKLDGPRIGRDKFFNILRERGLLVKKKAQVRKDNELIPSLSYIQKHRKKHELTGPDQAVASDITYLRTEKCFLYLSLQTDLYSRKITGWDLSISLSVEGSIRALGMTIKQSRNPNGMIHHSDRGIQYCCKAYIEKLRKYKMQISMTEENHCYENAVAERINGILKQEFDLDSTFRIIRRHIKQ